MALDLDVFESDLTGIITDMPVTLVFGSESASVTRSGGTESHDLQMPGIIEDYDEEFMGKVSDWAAIPGKGQTVTVDGVSMKIQRSFVAADGKGFHLWVRKI